MVQGREPGSASGGRAGDGREPEPAVPRELAAEAAVWIARLHGPGRSKHMERECRAWQARSAAHRLAFERGTDLWMDAAGVDRAAVARAAAAHAAAAHATTPESRPSPRAGWLRARRGALALTAVVLVGVLGLELWRDAGRYDTGVGEQRLVMLQDGTRMTLNTATRVRVDLGKAQRTVQVEGGEALFEVAKDASRPFVVRAAGSEVQATGTAFVVRYTPQAAGLQEAVDVTLVEGRVVVLETRAGTPAERASSVEMAPGERLRVSGRAGLRKLPAESLTPKLDRPRVAQLLAWTRGEAVFDDVSLAEAVAEMNRYSAVPIVLSGAAAVGGLRVSGVFKTGDNLSFARAVATLHGLVVRETAEAIVLARH